MREYKESAKLTNRVNARKFKTEAKLYSTKRNNPVRSIDRYSMSKVFRV